MSIQTINEMRAVVGIDDATFRAGAKRIIATATGMAGQVSGSWESVSRAMAINGKAFDQLRASIDPAFAATQKYAEIQREIAGYVEAGAVSQKAANAALEQAASRYMGVATSAERAIAAEREQAQAVALATQNYEALRGSLDPIYASSMRYASAQETLAAAVKSGVVSQEQADRLLDTAGQKYLGLATATEKAGAASAAGKGNFKMFSQQLSQVAQQGAVTGDYITALTLQMGDMALAFGAAGALIGAGIVVMGPFIAKMFSAEAQAKAMDDALKGLQATGTSVQTAFDAMSQSSEELSKKFGAGTETARKLFASLYQIESVKFGTQLADTVKSVTGAFAGLTGTVKEYDQALAWAGSYNDDFYGRQAIDVMALNKQFGLTVEGARKLSVLVTNLENANGPEAVAIAAQQLAAGINDAVASGAHLPPQMVDAAKALIETGISAQNVAALMAMTQTSTTGATSAMGQLATVTDAARVAAAALLSTMNAAGTAAENAAADQIRIVRAQIDAVKSGSDQSIAASRAQIAIDKEKYVQMAMSAGLSTDAIAKEISERFKERDALVDMQEELAKETLRKNASTKATGAATKAEEKLNKQLGTQAQSYTDAVNPIAKYQHEMAELAKVQGLMSSEDYAAYARKLNIELADSLPLVGDLSDAFGQFVASGFKDFDNFGDAFKSLLAQMVADAAKAQIVMSMGITGSATSAAATATSVATGTGVSSITSGMNAFSLATSNFFKSTLSGAWSSISAAFSGGLSGLSSVVTTSFSNLTANVGALFSGGSSVASALGAFGTALGAVAAPLAAIAAVVSFFGTKTKLLDAGIKATISDTDVLVQTYKTVKKSKFWGLSSSTKTSTSAASAEVADPITQAINATQLSILKMAGVLGIASDQFDKFAYTISVSTKGLSDDEISEALQQAMSDAADAYSLMINGLDDLIGTGETATEALTRLSTALTTVNGAFDTLGYELKYAGLAGAATSSALETLFGSADAFSSSVSTYWQDFYSESERQAILTRQATTALAAYNIALPQSRDQYRALIEAQDLTTESGRELWAMLVQMAGTFDEILPTISSITTAMETLMGTTSTSLSSAIDSLTDLQKINAAAADDWYKVADSVADLIGDIRGTAGTVTTAAQALSYNQAQYQTAYAKAMGGDLDAAQNVATLAKSYLTSAVGAAGSRSEAAIAQAKLLAQLSALDVTSTRQGATFDTVAALQGQMLTVLGDLSDLISSGNIDASSILAATLSGNGLTSAQLAEIQANNGLSAGQVSALASLNALATATNGLSTEQLSALTSIKTLGASELAAFYTAISGLNTQTGTLNGSLLGMAADAKSIIAAIGADNSADMVAAVKSASTAMGALLTSMEGLRAAMIAAANATGTVSTASIPAAGDSASTASGNSSTTNTTTTPKTYSLTDYTITTRNVGGTAASDRQYQYTITGPLGGTKTVRTTSQVSRDAITQAQQWLTANNFPAFASGGVHSGGVRLVGENGPELEATGPSRIYSARDTSQMLGGANDALIAEVKALRAEIAEMRDTTQKVADNTSTASKVLKKLDAIGIAQREDA